MVLTVIRIMSMVFMPQNKSRNRQLKISGVVFPIGNTIAPYLGRLKKIPKVRFGYFCIFDFMFMLDSKVCNKCDDEKLLSLFYTKKNGKISGACKSCHNAHVNEYYKNNKVRLAEEKNSNLIKDSKICNKCGDKKSLDLFYIRKDGRVNYICKNCSKISVSEYNKNNKTRLSERDGNKERIQKNQKKYYLNCDKVTRKLKDLTYYNTNKKNISKKRRKYQSSEHAKAKRNIYRKNKMSTDPCYKIRHRLKDRIYYALKGIAKSEKTLKLLGCTLPFFKNYLEERFTERMNWDNYGLFGWHIDHRFPCASFDLTKKEEQEKCFHYTNMQPLWCTDNILKGDKIIY